jgi:hypothetical protein
MGSSLKKDGSESLVTVTTSALKERLNQAYDANRKKQTQLNNFDSLWDLKEKALLEGKKSIEVPQTWMEELDGALKQAGKN